MSSGNALLYPIQMLLCTGTSVGKHQIMNRMTESKLKYKFIWSFKAHVVYGGGSDTNEDESHHIEVQ